MYIDDYLSVDELVNCCEAEMKALEEEDNKKEDSEYQELLDKYHGDHYKSLFEYCFKHNIFYCSQVLKTLLKEKDEEFNNKMPDLYINALQEESKFKGLDFFSQIKQDNFEKIYSGDLALLSLTEDDKKNRQTIVEIFSYDPFKDEKPEDRPQLYRDLAGMTTEAMRKDIAKQKAALSIVRSYRNIENYQNKVTEITANGSIDEDTQKLLDSYLKVISNIQSTINQTAEKNNFTVKGVGSNGKGMLSDVLNQVGVQVVDEAVINFYDIATSKAIEEVANISWQSMLHQVNLSKTDYVEILGNQVRMVTEAVAIAKKSKEALRLAKEKITKQELLEELAQDYRRKGISEEEIEEFIHREFNLYDGKE